MRACLAFSLVLFAAAAFARAAEERVPATLVVLKAPAEGRGDTVCRFGVPLRRGRLRDADQIALLDGEKEVPCGAEAIAKWPDGSIRAVAVRFRTSAAKGEKALQIAIGRKRTAGANIPPPKSSAAMPDAFVKLPPEFLCDSAAFGGAILPASKTDISKDLDKRLPNDLEASVWSAVQSGKMPTDYDRGLHDFFYYDLAHSTYSQYARTGLPNLFITGYAAARTYREEMVIHEGAKKGRPRGTPGEEIIPEEGLRTMYIEGLLDDWQLTGDGRSMEVAREIADAYVENLPRQGRNLRVNERNPGWPLLELTYFYDVTREKRYLDSAALVFEDVLKWQDETGAWLRVYEDKDECPHGCRGAQPFMHTLLVEGIVRYWRLTGDERAKACLKKAAAWLLTPAAGWRESQGAWRYLPGCISSKDKDGVPDLSLIIAQSLAVGWQLTGEVKYRNAALKAFEAGVARGNIGNGKQFSQDYRNSAYCIAYLSAEPGTYGPERESTGAADKDK